MYLLVCSVSSDAHLSAVVVGFVCPFYPRFRAQWFRYNLADLPDLVVSTIVAMGGIEPPSALMLIAISPWLRVEGTAVGLTHPTLSS